MGQPSQYNPVGSGYAPRSNAPSPSWDYKNPYTPNDVPSNQQPPRNPYAPVDNKVYRPSPVNPGNRGAFFPENSYVGRDMGQKSSIFDGMSSDPRNPKIPPSRPNPISPGSALNIGGKLAKNLGILNNISGVLGPAGRLLDYAFPPPVSDGTIPPGKGENDFYNPPSDNGGLPPGEAVPIGEYPPSNFEKYFNDFIDNFYGGEVEPPIIPPFLGGQVTGQLYTVEGFAERVSEYNKGKLYTMMDGFYIRAVGPIGGFKVGINNGAKCWYLENNNDPIWSIFGNGLPAYYHDGSIKSHLPSYQIINFIITKITPVNPPPGFKDKDQYTSPGTSAPPNTNFTPLGLILGGEPGLDTGLDTGLDPGLFPGGEPAFDILPALDPTQHPGTYDPPTPFPPDQLKPLPPNLEPPSNDPYTRTNTNTNTNTNNDDNLLGGRFNRPPTSTSNPPGTQGSSLTGTNTTESNLTGSNTNTPTNTIDPNTGEPAPVTQTPSNPYAPNPSTTSPHDCDSPTDPCQVRLNNKLDEINENAKKDNQPNIQGEIDNIKCSKFEEIDNSPAKFSYTGKGIEGISNQLEALTKLQLEIKKDICRIEAIAGIPEVWLARYNNNTPQLIVLFAEVKDGKFGKDRYPITIPNYNGDRNPIFNPYEKGQYLGVLKLTDNSKLIINGKTKNVVKNYIEAIAKLINPAFLPKDLSIDPSKRANTTKEIKVYPVIARFYKNGVEKAEPEWIKYYQVPK